jgi:hypothetical protein
MVEFITATSPASVKLDTSLEKSGTIVESRCSGWLWIEKSEMLTIQAPHFIEKLVGDLQVAKPDSETCN